MAQDDNLDNDFEEGTTDDFAEEAAPAANSKPPKKKSGGGFIIVVLLLLLGGGGIVAAPLLGIKLPFSIPGLPDAAPPQDAAANTPPAADPATQASAQDPASQAPVVPAEPVQVASGLEAEVPAVDGTAQNAPAILPPADNMPPAIDSLTPNGEPEIASPGVQPSPEAQGTAPDILGGASPQIAAPAVIDPLAVTAPVADPLATPQIAAPVTVETPVVVDSQVAPAAQPDASAIQTQVLDPVTAPVQAAAAPSEDLAKLEGRIAGLEKNIADMQQNLVSKNDISDLKSAISALEQKMSSGMVQEKAPRAASTDAVKNAKREVENYRHGIMPETVKIQKPVESGVLGKAVSKAASGKMTGSASSWVLKSAKPGMAWVAEKGASELKTVSVGDSLTGVGKVTSIAKDASGRWVVSGTKGFVRQ